MPKNVKNVIKSRKKFQWSWFFIFKLYLGVLNIPEIFSSIGVAVPEIWYKRVIAPSRQKKWRVIWPQMPPNRLVWFFISPKDQKKSFGGISSLKDPKVMGDKSFLHHWRSGYTPASTFPRQGALSAGGCLRERGAQGAKEDSPHQMQNFRFSNVISLS